MPINNSEYEKVSLRYSMAVFLLHSETVIILWFIRSNYDVNSTPAGFAPRLLRSRLAVSDKQSSAWAAHSHTRYRSMLDEKWQAGHKRSQVLPASRGIIAVCLTLHPVMGGTRTPKGFGLVIILISLQVIKHIGRVRVFLNTFLLNLISSFCFGACSSSVLMLLEDFWKF